MARFKQKKELRSIAEPIEIVNSAVSGSVSGYTMLLYIGLILMLGDIDSNPENTKYSFDVKDISEYMDLGYAKNAYKKLKKIADNVLYNDVVYTMATEENGLRKIEKYRTYQSISYIDQAGRIELDFTTKFKKIAVELIKKNGFSVFFSLAEVLPMKSEYSKKIFPSLISNLRPMKFNGKGTVSESEQSFTSIYPVDDFKALIGLPSSYQTVGLKRVCDSIVKDVNDYSAYRCTVTYNFISARGGGGKKMTHVLFRTSKKSAADLNGTMAKEIGTAIPEKVLLREWWKNRTGFNDDTIDSTLRMAAKYKRDKSFLEKAYTYTEEQCPDKPAAYVIALIRNGFDEKTMKKRNAFTDTVKRTSMDYEKMAEQEEMDKVLHGFD